MTALPSVGHCPACRRLVIWAVTANSKRIPLDPGPDPDGNEAAYRDDAGVVRVRQLRDGEMPLRFERVYMPHFASSPACAPPRPSTRAR